MSEGSESTELANELFMEQVEKEKDEPEVQRWHKLVALSTLIMALLAALGGLLSGITAHESALEKNEEIISLTIQEGDRVSVEVLKAKYEILISLGETPDEEEIEAIREFEAEIQEKRNEIAQEERLAQTFGQIYMLFAVSVTILAAGISLSGMSVVVSQKWLWYVGMVVGAIGAIGVVLGITLMLI